MTWTIREMALDEVHRISEIDVSERGDVLYKWRNGRIEAVPECWRRPQSYGDGWQERAEMVRAALAQGGLALGAFDAGRLVGFAALRDRLAGDMAQLQALWVSADYRRKGIATALVERLFQHARDSGAGSVYVSATPSESAQAFYRSRGFRPTEFVHRELYELEPEDIHMVKRL